MGSSPFVKPSERTVIDKLFAREDIERIREMSKTTRLSKAELQELLHLLTSVEPKLLNLKEWTMYAMSQFLVGITGFVTLAMQYCDAQDLINERKALGKVSKRTEELFEESRLKIDRSMRFIVNVFSYSGRVTLSKDALAFKEFVRAQWELEYAKDRQQGLIPQRDYFNLGQKAT